LAVHCCQSFHHVKKNNLYVSKIHHHGTGGKKKFEMTKKKNRYFIEIPKYTDPQPLNMTWSSNTLSVW
jgi:hypothetical protein